MLSEKLLDLQVMKELLAYSMGCMFIVVFTRFRAIKLWNATIR